MKKTTNLILFLVVLLVSCSKENKVFSLKTVSLNGYKQTTTKIQKLYLKVFGDNVAVALGQTTLYPSDLPLPITFNVYPTVPMSLYRKTYTIQLWGDSSGFIHSCQINMDNYKIIFPIDMVVKSDSLNVSIMGSWE